jgi:hypothetical protein
MNFVNNQNLIIANNVNEYTSDSATIDYVLYRTGDPRESLQSISCAVDPMSTGLSDHKALLGQFSFSANYDAFPDLQVTDILSFEYDPLFDGIGRGIATAVIKNNGPAASPANAVYMVIPGIKYNNGIGSCPALGPGNSAVVQVEYWTPQGQIPEDWIEAEIQVIADRSTDSLKGGLIRENNETNNLLDRVVPIIWINSKRQ